MEIKWRAKNVDKETALRIVTDYNAGMKIRLICERYAITKTTLYAVLKRIANEISDKN